MNPCPDQPPIPREAAAGGFHQEKRLKHFVESGAESADIHSRPIVRLPMFRALIRYANTLLDIIAFPSDNADAAISCIPPESAPANPFASVPGDTASGYLTRKPQPHSRKWQNTRRRS
jgi:hypothetical protein